MINVNVNDVTPLLKTVCRKTQGPLQVQGPGVVMYEFCNHPHEFILIMIT